MAKRAFAVFAIFLSASLAVARDKTSFPKQIVVAKYVLVTTYFGDNLADSRVPPVDRQAANDAMDAIRDWGRYMLVYERKAADLIILVRKGRRAETREGIAIHAGSSLPKPEIGPIAEIDGGDPADMIAVYDASRGIDTAPLWRERMSDGLDPPVNSLATFASKLRPQPRSHNSWGLKGLLFGRLSRAPTSDRWPEVYISPLIGH